MKTAQKSICCSGPHKVSCHPVFSQLGATTISSQEQNSKTPLKPAYKSHIWASHRLIWQIKNSTVVWKVVISKKSWYPEESHTHTYFGMQLGTTQATAVQRKGQEINIAPPSLAGLSPAVFQLPAEFSPSLWTATVSFNVKFTLGPVLLQRRRRPDVRTDHGKTMWSTCYTWLMHDALVSSSDVVGTNMRYEQSYTNKPKSDTLLICF